MLWPIPRSTNQVDPAPVAVVDRHRAIPEPVRRRDLGIEPVSGTAALPSPRQRRWADARPVRSPAVARGGDQPASDEGALGGTGDPEAEERSPEPTDRGRAERGSTSEEPNGVPWFLAGAACLGGTALLAQSRPTGIGAFLVPLGAVLMAVAASRRIARLRPDETWVGRWLVLGVLVKLTASYLRYQTLVRGYEGIGDASGYDRFGRRFARAWTMGRSAPKLDDLRETNFIRWFTGVVYYLFGSSFLLGFFVFGLLALIGSYFWYRATVDAVPAVNKKLYLALVLLAPSVTFWPSSIGKESLMQLGIGVMALGTSFLLRQRLLLGLAIGAAGGWLVWVVRPHLVALVTVAAGCAYLLGRVRAGERGLRGVIGRPIGLVAVALLIALTITQGAEFLGLDDLSVSSIEAELDQQTERSAQGGSEFDNGGNSLNPLRLPMGAVTVLLRPFPWETDSPLQLIASLESALLAALIVIRISSVRTSLIRARAMPYLLYCWVLVVLYAATFSSFANFGLLVRQRSLVLPAVFALLAVSPARARSLRQGERPAPEVPMEVPVHVGR